MEKNLSKRGEKSNFCKQRKIEEKRKYNENCKIKN